MIPSTPAVEELILMGSSRDMEKAKQNGKMASNMTENGIKTSSTVKALKPKKMVRYTKENSTAGRNKDMASTGGPTEACIEASGITI